MQSCHINPEVLEIVSNLSETRRYLHMHPELSLKEFKTSEFICKFLEECGLKVITKVGHPTGLVGILTGEAGPGPCILFRADIDGLPIKDIKQVEYKSQNENVLHACGHDGHMTCLLYAAKILSKNKHKLKGHIKFCFEPGEEVGKGSKAMIEDPIYPVLLSEPKVDFCFGFHL